MTTKYIEEDIHTAIFKLPENSFDLLYCSPPYGITSSPWDNALKWDILFPEIWRVLKPDGICIIHASMPFTYELLKYETPKYHYTWLKNNSTNFFKAKLQPLRNTEEVFVYYKKTGTYNPQMVGNEKYSYKPRTDTSKNQYLGIRKNNPKQENSHTGKYPTTLLKYDIRKKDKSGINRPDEMIDYFIKTYSNESETILYISCHNNYVGDRCIKLNRNYLGIDINLPDELKLIPES